METATTYSFLEMQTQIISGEGLLLTVKLEASLLKHGQDAALHALHRVILVAQKEVGLLIPPHLNIDNSGGPIRS